MKMFSNDKLISITFLTIICLVVGYIIYVVNTATHKPGCTNSYENCVRSHLDIRDVYYGKYWHQIEDEVCDEYETVTYDCECITYHWFWGDYKNY